jgi:hypothetical protein
MRTSFRRLTGSITLAAGVCSLSLAAAADTPELPKDSYKKAADADPAFLQARLADLAEKQATGRDVALLKRLRFSP